MITDRAPVMNDANLPINSPDTSTLNPEYTDSDTISLLTQADTDNAVAPAPSLSSDGSDKSHTLRAPSTTPMSWTQAGKTVGKHALYGLAGFMPFAAATTAVAVNNAVDFGHQCLTHYGQEGFSVLNALLDSAGSTVKVGAAITLAGMALAYPLGRHVIAPAAQKSYEVCVPDDLKAVASFAAQETPGLIKHGYHKLSQLTAETYQGVKQLPETAPSTLVQAGVTLGGLTQRGADAVTQVTQSGMQKDARYQQSLSKKASSGENGLATATTTSNPTTPINPTTTTTTTPNRSQVADSTRATSLAPPQNNGRQQESGRHQSSRANSQSTVARQTVLSANSERTRRFPKQRARIAAFRRALSLRPKRVEI